MQLTAEQFAEAAENIGVLREHLENMIEGGETIYASVSMIFRNINRKNLAEVKSRCVSKIDEFARLQREVSEVLQGAMPTLEFLQQFAEEQAEEMKESGGESWQ